MIARDIFKARCEGCNKKGGAHRKNCPALRATMHAADLVSRASRAAHKPGTVAQILNFGKCTVKLAKDMIYSELEKRGKQCGVKHPYHKIKCHLPQGHEGIHMAYNLVGRTKEPKIVSFRVLGKDGAKLAKDMVYSAHADAPKQQQSSQSPPQERQQPKSWLADAGKDYDEFTSHFVSPRQSVLHLGGEQAKGSEQFGQHVAARLAASPTGDGMTPGEKTTA